MDEQNRSAMDKIVTIPNILSLFRLVLVPIFCWTYLGLQDEKLTVILLAISGLSDIVDGFIARHFNMISDLGKVLDPLADKVTQAAMLLCLLIVYPALLPAFILLVVKELSDLITGGLVVKRTSQVLQAQWHGKLTTVLLYVTLMLHVIWPAIPAWGEIPSWLTVLLSALCCIMSALSMILYAVRNFRALRTYQNSQK